METCSGARRGKQKAQHQHQVIEETQLHYPHQQQHHHHHHHHHMHPLQQLQEQQFIQQHQQQQQQQQLQKQPQQQQLMSQKHHHTKPIQAEKYGLSVIMHSGSSTRQNNCSPTPQQAFPHFPPPPTYPPPGITLSGTKQQANASGTLVTPLGVMNMCPGGSADSGNSSSGGGVGTIIPSRRLVHRYPEDLDSIEVCPEQDSHTVKSFRNRSGGSNGSLDGSSGGGNVGGMDSGSSTRSTGSHGKMTVESQAKWPRNNISATMEKFPQSPSAPCGPMSMPHTHQDYSYAYYEPGAAMRHSNIPPPEQVAGPSRPPPPNSIRALLSKGKKNKLLVSPSTRQSYQTRYGTQENFYEEIAGEERNAMMIAAGHSLASINQSMMEEEFRRVQNRHRKVLGELNLSVEAMLMPETPPSNSPTEEEPTDQSSDHITELLSTVGPTDELLSPISSSNPAFCGDLDSGFSGSSGASYIGSLRYHKTNAALSNLMTARKSMKSTSGGTHSGNASATNSSSGGASGTLGSSFYNSNSCRSSQRSHEDTTEHSTALLARASCGRSIAVSSYTKAKSAEDPGPSSATESKARSFWNRKGWRKLPGFSSTSSVHQAGTGKWQIWVTPFYFNFCLLPKKYS